MCQLNQNSPLYFVKNVLLFLLILFFLYEIRMQKELYFSVKNRSIHCHAFLPTLYWQYAS